MYTNLENKVNGKPYNPFIHGTTNATIVALSNTDYQLMPTLKMLDKYQIAPMTGELTHNGYKELGHETTEDSLIGAIAFGQLYGGSYNLEHVILNYTKFTTPTRESCINAFKSLLKTSSHNAFSELNLLLIYFARVKQMNLSLEGIIEKQELESLLGQLHATVQFYCLIQLLGLYIYPDFAAIDEATIHQDLEGCFKTPRAAVLAEVYRLLKFENIIQKIVDTKLNIEEIVHNPTEINLKKALQILELPQESKLTTKQFFGLTKNKAPWEIDRLSNIFNYTPEGVFRNMSQNIQGYDISSFLFGILEGKGTNDFFLRFAANCEKHIIVLKDRIRLFEKLINIDTNNAFHRHHQLQLSEQFPVILVTESEKVKPFNTEYRSTVSLKLGEDITLVATDTDENRTVLKDYFCAQHIKPVQVVLISDLQVAARTYNSSMLPLSIDSPPLRNLLSFIDTHKQADQFYKFYQLLDNLNDERNQFRNTDPKAFEVLDELFIRIDKLMWQHFSDDKNINNHSIHMFCQKCTTIIKEQKNILEQHIGIMEILDAAVTVISSLIVFYPAVYLYQKYNQIRHSFFGTYSSDKATNVLQTLAEIDEQILYDTYEG